MASDLEKWASSVKPKVPVATGKVANRALPPRRPVVARPQSKSGGGITQILLLGILAAAGYFTYEHLQKQQPDIKHGIAENLPTHTVETLIPDTAPTAHPPDRTEPSPTITLLAPETKYIPKSLSATFNGKWAARNNEHDERWIAYPNGKLELVGQKWEVTWNILEDGTLEIRSPENKPCSFSRDGDGWIGTNIFGKKVTLRPGNW